MSNHRVIQGTYSDFKIIKTRSVAQLIIEVPLEQASDAVEIFGLPTPESEKWVAVAMLNETAINKDENAVKAIQQAGMLCKSQDFGNFLNAQYNMDEVNPNDAHTIANGLRTLLGVRTRTDMHDNPDTVLAFNRIKGEYDQWLINN